MRRAISPSRLSQLASHFRPHHYTRHIFTARLPTTKTTSSSSSSPPSTSSTSKMSTSSPSPTAAGAPWRDLFVSHLEGMESAEFTLSTLRRASSPSTTSSASASGAPRSSPLLERRSSVLAAPVYHPRARTCICRGLFAHLPVNPKNEAPLNPEGVWESELITFTTDSRMDKMEELWENGFDFDLRGGGRRGGADPGSPTTDMVGEELWEEGLARRRGKRTTSDENAVHNKHTKEQKLQGSGGGGTVEAVFWPRETGVQWRLRGRAYVLAPDIEISVEGYEVMTTLKSRMRRPNNNNNDQGQGQGQGQDDDETKWSFAREITAHFGNLSPAMRGTFRNPPPGRPVSLPVEGGEDLRLGQKVTDLEDPIARANFRLVVIVPEEVDQADLSDPENPRRWIHTYVGLGRGTAGWETVEVWP